METGVVVVGCGYWGRNLARTFSELGSLASICDADEGALAEQAALYPAVEATSGFTDALASDVGVVVLATPAATHFQMAVDALAAGKDVFVEKPLALRYRDGRQLVEAAEAAGRILMVGHVLEYHPAFEKLKELIAGGELGELRYVYSNRLNLGRVRREENILWSFAPHDISAITTLLSAEPLQVATSGGSYLREGIADVTLTSMLFPGGIRAHVFVSWLHPFKEQRLVVIGDQRMAVFSDTEPAAKLKIYDIDWHDGEPTQRSETVVGVSSDEPLRRECEHLLACVRGRAHPRTDGINGLKVLRILEASQTSLERGGAIVSLSEVT